jgi:hypothetical protein
MASRGGGNHNLTSAGSANSQQHILDVASQHNHFQYPSDDPEDATTPWMNQLKGIWALCRLCMQLIKSLLNASFVNMRFCWCSEKIFWLAHFM